MIKSNLFIHIPKTGGTTIHKLLGEYASGPGRNHWRAIDAKEQWPSHFFYTFLRNPYTRIVSLYESQFPRKVGHYHLPNEDVDLTFERYVQIIVEGEHDDKEHFNHWRPQTDWILDENDNLIVDYIGHTETLMKDCNEILRLINAGVIMQDPVKEGFAPKPSYIQYPELSSISLNSSNWRFVHYEDYFNDEVRKKVEKYYGRDIDLLKVKFK